MGPKTASPPPQGHRPRALAVGLAAAAALLYTASATPIRAAPPFHASAGPCNQDGDCLGTRLCRAHRCVVVQCEASADCAAGRLCRGHRCVRRACTEDLHCPIERSCQDGLCVLPAPPSLRNGNADTDVTSAASRTGEVPLDVTAGVAFPVGLLVCVDALLGGERSVSVGVGTAVDSGGFSWRIGVHGAPHRLGPVTLDLWTAALGNAGGPSDARLSPTSVALGSGRGLFAADRAVRAVWWGAGGGATWRHGPGRDRLLRLEVGALLLLGDAYPATADYALLPAFSLRYGVSW